LALNVEEQDVQENLTASCVFPCLTKFHLRRIDAGHFSQLNILFFFTEKSERNITSILYLINKKKLKTLGKKIYDLKTKSHKESDLKMFTGQKTGYTLTKHSPLTG